MPIPLLAPVTIATLSFNRIRHVLQLWAVTTLSVDHCTL
jgi:hypothetical protein